MYTTSPVQPFDDKNDKNHDDGGNKKVYKWKMLVEKHKDDLRKLWDNKSKETDVNLGSHIKQFDRYIGQQEKRVAGFIVVAPSFTEESVAEAMRYQVEKGTSISLITASELKELAERWSKKDKGTFPLGYLVLPGRFNPSVVTI